MKDFGSNPLVSVIIPAYNSLQYLDDTIQSILDQTYENIEIVLVDDGSSDGTKECFSKWERKGVYCFYQDNQGAAAARNNGMSRAKGDFLQFLDADDTLLPDKIEVQINVLKSKPGHSFCRWRNFNEKVEKGKLGGRNELFVSDKISGHECLELMGKHKAMVATAAWLWRTELVKHNVWKHSPNDDGEFSFDALINDPVVNVQDEVLVGYRVSSLDWSRISTKEKHTYLIDCWKRIEQKLNKSALKSKNSKLLVLKGYRYCVKSPAQLFIASQFRASLLFFIYGLKSGNGLLNTINDLWTFNTKVLKRSYVKNQSKVALG